MGYRPNVAGETLPSDVSLLKTADTIMSAMPAQKKRRPVPRTPAPPPTLPLDCVGLGCLIRSDLVGYAQSCRGRECRRGEQAKALKQINQDVGVASANG